jgi:hypothetical protein
MSPFIVLPVAIVVLIVGMYFLGRWCNIWPPVKDWLLKYDPAEFYDDELDSVITEYRAEIGERAVEIIAGRTRARNHSRAGEPEGMYDYWRRTNLETAVEINRPEVCVPGVTYCGPGCECFGGRTEKAVEINHFRLRPGLPVEIGARTIGPETFEIADMTLRLTKPHLYSDNWYQDWRRDFSQWAADEWEKIGHHRQEMGLTYAT